MFARSDLFDHGSDARVCRISQSLRDEVDSFNQRPGVDPFEALMPTLDRRRRENHLAHVAYLAIPISEQLLVKPTSLLLVVSRML